MKTRKISKMTDDLLWDEYIHLNKHFFEDKINLYRVAFTNKRNIDHADGAYFPTRKWILIDVGLRNFPRIVQVVLIHEMAHANLDLQGYKGYPGDGGHGDRFHVEIDRLYKLGIYDGFL